MRIVNPILTILLLTCISGPVARANEISTSSITIEWDHWLWMKRITERDPGWLPENFDSSDHEIRMFEKKSVRQIYEAIGLKLEKRETFFFAMVNTTLIARLNNRNFDRLAMIHKTIDAWRAGNTDEWYLEWNHRSTPDED